MHYQVKCENKRIYVHSLHGSEISEPHNLYCYRGIYNMGRTVLKRQDQKGINIKLKIMLKCLKVKSVEVQVVVQRMVCITL